MFEYLKDYKVIIVTGPQRSGTRIGAKCIAHDLGYEYIDEAEVYVDSLYQLVTVVRARDNSVIQCPALSHVAHELASPRAAVVMMVRDVKDIVASQERIDWAWELVEYAQYQLATDYWRWDDSTIASVKYSYWDQYWNGRPHCFDLEYESLRGHPLWVPGELRKNFGFSQTEVE